MEDACTFTGMSHRLELVVGEVANTIFHIQISAFIHLREGITAG